MSPRSPSDPVPSSSRDAPTEAPTEAIVKGYERGRSAHGSFALTADEFVAAALTRAAARRERLGLAPGPDASAAAGLLVLEDLYLACACDRGDEGAWRVLHEAFTPRLRGLALRRGVRGGDVESEVADLLADLAMPAPNERARTVIGTFAGSGSLWAWLAASLVRRLALRAARASASAADISEHEPGVSVPPWRASVDDETARRLDAALSEAWAALDANERLCLVWKHRHGMEQRRIAKLLGVGEHQVSRFLSRAVAKVRGAVERCAGPLEGESRDLWHRLTDVVARHLARVDPGAPPPGGPRARTEGPPR